MHSTVMASGQVPEFIRKDQWPPNSPDPWTTMSWVRCWRPITSSCPKPKSVTKLKEALQVIWDSLPQDPVNKAVKSFTIQPMRCAKACGEHCEHTQWLSNVREIVHCDVSVILLAQTFFVMQKLLGDHAEISLSLMYCYRLLNAAWQ